MKTRQTLWIAIPLIAATVLGSHYWPRPLSRRAPSTGNTRSQPPAFSASGYASLLQKYTTPEGWVRYRQLKTDRQELDGFVAALARLSREDYESWNEEEQLAFWINTYNALTLVTIVNHYPAQPGLPGSPPVPFQSIRQIPGVWDRLQFTVVGSPQNLNQIENQILRKRFDEPRIHMALVCAAKGCPPLRAELFEGAKLESQLEDQTRQFLSRPSNFRIDRAGRQVVLSSLFRWYGEDFVESFGTEEAFEGHSPVERAVLNFISPYLDAESRGYLAMATYRIGYLDYDWALNDGDAMAPCVSQAVWPSRESATQDLWQQKPREAGFGLHRHI